MLGSWGVVDSYDGVWEATGRREMVDMVSSPECWTEEVVVVRGVRWEASTSRCFRDGGRQIVKVQVRWSFETGEGKKEAIDKQMMG